MTRTLPHGSKGPTKMLCPCGGSAWSLDELLALSADEPYRDMWRSLLGPDDYYCSDEDDVLLPGEARPR